MKPVLTVAVVVTLVSTGGASAAAQVGIRMPASSLHDSVPAWPLFNPAPKSALSVHDWTLPPPAAHLADAPRAPIGARRCPMPVFALDSIKDDRMPVSRSDSAMVERMPVAKSDCLNPLWSKSRP